jgi:hypothetical protein
MKERPTACHIRTSPKNLPAKSTRTRPRHRQDRFAFGDGQGELWHAPCELVAEFDGLKEKLESMSNLYCREFDRLCRRPQHRRRAKIDPNDPSATFAGHGSRDNPRAMIVELLETRMKRR